MSIRPPALLFRLVCVAALAVAASQLPLTRPEAALADVRRLDGYAAVVDGWRSWYGSYGMGDIGTTWCIDHGIRAPDPALGYVPVEVDRPEGTRRALAWMFGAHGRTPDRVEAAGLMLAGHDLMGAVYPSGPLNVEQLSVDRMHGFEGQEVAVLERARQLKADALAHSHLRPPFSLTAAVEPSAPIPLPGATATLAVRVTDGSGAGVAGVALHAAVSGAILTGPVEAVTDGDGWMRLPFTTVPGENRFVVTGVAPDLDLSAFGPTVRPAQRVARPAVVGLHAEAAFIPQPPPPPPRRHVLTVVKTGDATAYLPVTGARFALRGGEEEHIVTVGESGRGRVELPAGQYSLHEVDPPEGYAVAGPWSVDLRQGDRTIEVANVARRGSAVVTKADAVTGAPVDGAALQVRYDGDADGVPETDVARFDSSREPESVELTDLLPGDYIVEELTPPDGYAAAEALVPFSVAPGETTEVTVVNQPRSTVAFEKVPTGLFDSEALSLAGGRFLVGEVGGCTTDDTGRCVLDGLPLNGGDEYCWREVEAPPGWGRADGGCFVAAPEPGGVHVITVEEPSRYSVVTGHKSDVETGRPLAGATYHLYRVDDAALGAAPSRVAPAGSVVLLGHTWVGSATSDDGGTLEWPPQIAGYTYCALERRPPPGYATNPELECTPRPLDSVGAMLELRDAPLRTVLERVVHAAPTLASPPPLAPPSPPSPRAAPPLAATGIDTTRLASLGGALIALGFILTLFRRR